MGAFDVLVVWPHLHLSTHTSIRSWIICLFFCFYFQTQGRPELRTRRKILINRCINVSTLLEKFKPAVSPEADAEPAPAPQPQANDDNAQDPQRAENNETQGQSKAEERGDSVDGGDNKAEALESNETEQPSSKAAL